MGEVRKQFTFYRSYYEALLPLPKETQANVLLAVCAYAFYEAEPDGLSAVELAAFGLIKPTLDASRRKAMAGKKGGEARERKQGLPSKDAEAMAYKQGRTSKKEEEIEDEVEKEREKEEEIEKESYNPLPPSGGQDWVWNEIVNLYPPDRIGNQSSAEQAYRMAVRSDADADRMLENLKAWIYSSQWNKADGQYIPLLANWIGRGTWETKPKAVNGCSYTSGRRQTDDDEIKAIHRMLGME